MVFLKNTKLVSLGVHSYYLYNTWGPHQPMLLYHWCKYHEPSAVASSNEIIWNTGEHQQTQAMLVTQQSILIQFVMGYKVPCKWTHTWCAHTHTITRQVDILVQPQISQLWDNVDRQRRDEWHMTHNEWTYKIRRWPRSHSTRQVLWDNKDSPILMTSATLYHIGPTMGGIMTLEV